MKKIISLLIAVLFASLPFVSCNVFSTYDGGDYSVETVTSNLSEDDEMWHEIADMLHVLSVDSADIPEFDTMAESAELFRDSLLNYMYGKNYKKYAGNSKLLNEINEEFPELGAIGVIPASEFEAEMYRCFGGSVKITHRSTSLFTYLKSESVYVPITAPIEGGVDLVPVSIAETENTYRVEFSCKWGDRSLEYFALLIKRDDGTCYFSAVLKTES